MTRVRCTILVACLVSLQSPFSAAQTRTPDIAIPPQRSDIAIPPQRSDTAIPPQQSIETLLTSGEPRLVAWGAHNALAANRRDLVPDLLSLAARWQPIVRKDPDAWNAEDNLPQEDLDRRDAMQAVLDTLIQMNVPVPADVLRTLAPEFGNDVAVLLSRMPQEQAAPLAFDFYHTASHGSLGYMSAALLALHPQPGFAADMLKSTDVYVSILVVRPGERSGFAHSNGDCFAGGGGGPREDWPSTGQYMVRGSQSVAANIRRSAVLLVGGIDPLYAVREEAKYYRAGFCGTGVVLQREDRRGLIAEMLGIALERMPWETELQPNIEFHSVEQLQADIRGFVAEEQAKFRLTVAGLLHRNLITQAEAQTALPHLILHVDDERQDENAAEITRPADLPANVEWIP